MSKKNQQTRLLILSVLCSLAALGSAQNDRPLRSPEQIAWMAEKRKQAQAEQEAMLQEVEEARRLLKLRRYHQAEAAAARAEAALTMGLFKSQVWKVQGEIAMAQGFHDEAVRLFEADYDAAGKAVTLDQASWLVLAYAAAGRHEDARRELVASLKYSRGPRSVALEDDEWGTLPIARGYTPAAVQAMALVARGYRRDVMAERKEAEEDLLAAHKLAPSSVAVAFRLAEHYRVYEKEPAKALPYYRIVARSRFGRLASYAAYCLERIPALIDAGTGAKG